MSKISKKGLEKSIKKYLTSLEPVAKGVPIKIQTSSNADGSIAIKEQKGDVYLEDQMATSFSKAISQAVSEHVSLFIHDVVVGKLNELIGEYNQLRADVITGGISTTSTEVEEISIT
ncbi:MAG: hypothetical protein ACFFFC_00245 [Candidatus Thorarchaeota archaeon]